MRSDGTFVLNVILSPRLSPTPHMKTFAELSVLWTVRSGPGGWGLQKNIRYLQALVKVHRLRNRRHGRFSKSGGFIAHIHLVKSPQEENLEGDWTKFHIQVDHFLLPV